MSTQYSEGAQTEAASDSDAPGYEPGNLSIAEEVEALIEDGKTYIQAELAYQKSRAVFAADEAKAAAVFGLIAAALGSLALVGLTVGLIIALSPWLTPWGASALVVGAEAVGAALFARAAAKRWRNLIDTVQPDSETGS